MMVRRIAVMEQGLLRRIAAVATKDGGDGTTMVGTKDSGGGTTAMNLWDVLLPLHLSFVHFLRYDTLNPVG
jgi:hypothetical protein